MKSEKVTVTAYNPVQSQTDSTPGITASGLKLKREFHDGKIVALSRDLCKNAEFGQKYLLLVENEVFLVKFEDKMNKKFKKRCDLLFFDVKKSKKWGKKTGFLIRRN